MCVRVCGVDHIWFIWYTYIYIYKCIIYIVCKDMCTCVDVWYLYQWTRTRLHGFTCRGDDSIALDSTADFNRRTFSTYSEGQGCFNVRYLCVSKLVHQWFGWWLAPNRHRAIIWTETGSSSTEHTRIHLDEIGISTQKKNNLKLSSLKWRQFCSYLELFRK